MQYVIPWSVTCGQFPMVEPDWGIFLCAYMSQQGNKKDKQGGHKRCWRKGNKSFIIEEDDLGGSAKGLHLVGDNDTDSVSHVGTREIVVCVFPSVLPIALHFPLLLWQAGQTHSNDVMIRSPYLPLNDPCIIFLDCWNSELSHQRKIFS